MNIPFVNQVFQGVGLQILNQKLPVKGENNVRLSIPELPKNPFKHSVQELYIRKKFENAPQLLQSNSEPKSANALKKVDPHLRMLREVEQSAPQKTCRPLKIIANLFSFGWAYPDCLPPKSSTLPVALYYL